LKWWFIDHQRQNRPFGKSFSGLAKLIYPNKEMNEAQVLRTIRLGANRKDAKGEKIQTYIIDELFRSERVSFKYRIKFKWGRVEPETL